MNKKEFVLLVAAFIGAVAFVADRNTISIQQQIIFSQQYILEARSAEIAALETKVEGMIVIPALPEFAGGQYLGNGLLNCQSERACIHELGHYKDELMGFPSRSPEFQKAVSDYYAQHEIDKITACFGGLNCLLWRMPGIMNHPRLESADGWGGFSELYAEIYAGWRLGKFDIPVEFFPFFYTRVN